MIPDSDHVDLENEPVTALKDQQKIRYKKRFEQHIVDVEEVAGRILTMCGTIRKKSEKAKQYPMITTKQSSAFDIVSNDTGSRTAGADMVKISQMVGHLQKRSGTQAGLRNGDLRYVKEPILEQNRSRKAKVHLNARIKTAKVRNMTVWDPNQLSSKQLLLDFGSNSPTSTNK